MLRETALDESSYMGAQDNAVVPYGESRHGVTSSLLPSKTITGMVQQSMANFQQAEEINELNMNPQELGQLIVHLQDEIKIIKLQLENLPGYEQG